MSLNTAKKLLEWNKEHLVHASDIQIADIAKLFAPEFVVKANGRIHPANYDNYLEFLKGFKATIKSIDYTVHDYLVSERHVTMPLTAHIIRTDGTQQNYEAILILGFDEHDKITLWHEVYLEIS